MPSDRSGREMAAPSGKFCSPMPMARAIAPASTSWPTSLPATENARPTAMPSGILCSVTAKTIMVVRRSFEGRPSGSVLPMCKWGKSWSSSIKNAPPKINPPPTGTSGLFPWVSAISMAGSSKDQTDAAIITPAAKPKKIFCVLSDISFLKKNTMPAPKTVARHVKPVPKRANNSSLVSNKIPP